MAVLTCQANATVLLNDDFETGSSSNWTANNVGTQWAVNTTSEVGNAFYGRSAATSSWSDMYGATTYTDVAVEAWVRINNWNANTQNRVYLMARANGTLTSTDTLVGYLVSIAPDSTITIEKRGANKAITTLALTHSQDVLGASWDPGNWTKLRIEVSGTSTTTLAIYVNGVQVATATDSSSPYTSGRAGFGSVGADADFDDVKVGDSDEFRGLESDQYALLKTTPPIDPLRRNAHMPTALLASARTGKEEV